MPWPLHVPAWVLALGLRPGVCMHGILVRQSSNQACVCVCVVLRDLISKHCAVAEPCAWWWSSFCCPKVVACVHSHLVVGGMHEWVSGLCFGPSSSHVGCGRLPVAFYSRAGRVACGWMFTSRSSCTPTHRGCSAALLVLWFVLADTCMSWQTFEGEPLADT